MSELKTIKEIARNHITEVDAIGFHFHHLGPALRLSTRILFRDGSYALFTADRYYPPRRYIVKVEGDGSARKLVSDMSTMRGMKKIGLREVNGETVDKFIIAFFRGQK